MTLTNMMARCALALKDPEMRTYWPGVILAGLLAGQDMFIRKVKPRVLPQLHVVNEAVAVDGNGAIELTGDDSELDYGIFMFPRGIEGIRLTDGKFCRKLSFEEYRQHQDNGTVFSTYEPVYYLRGTKAYIEPYTASTTTVDVFYWRKAVQMAEAEGETAEVDCEFDDNEMLRCIILLAKYDILSLDEERTDQAQTALEQALDIIEDLNQGIDESDGVNFDNEDGYEYDEDFPINVVLQTPEA